MRGRGTADPPQRAPPIALTVDDRARARGIRHAHAIRILARARIRIIRIIWCCWTDHTPYDPTRHGGALRVPDAA
jgi:hypothetical protein